MRKFTREIGSPKRKKRLRAELMRKQKSCCEYCGERFGPDRPPTFDHVVPFSRGGKHGKTNLVLACQPCNQRKADSVAACSVRGDQPENAKTEE